jgi:hypothetical protein
MKNDPVADYLADLDRRLRGRPNRDRLLAEAEDHLRESEAELRASGLAPDEAARTAVARLGPAGGVAAAGGGRAGVAAVVLTGAVTAAGLMAAAAAKDPGYHDAPRPALPLHLFFGGLGVAALTACVAWTVWAASGARFTRGTLVRGVMLTSGMAVAVALGELAIHEGKQRLYTMYCERDGEPPHKLFCNPQGARDFTSAELHALACVAAALVVLGVTAYAMHRHARRERARLGLPGATPARRLG